MDFSRNLSTPSKMVVKKEKAGVETVTLGPTVNNGEEVFAVAHIFASFNDTFVHITDLTGRETMVRVTGGMKVFVLFFQMFFIFILIFLYYYLFLFIICQISNFNKINYTNWNHFSFSLVWDVIIFMFKRCAQNFLILCSKDAHRTFWRRPLFSSFFAHLIFFVFYLFNGTWFFDS